MIKTITFSNYIETREKMPNKSINKIFIDSWKKTPQAKQYYENRKSFAKGVCSFTIFCFIIPIIMSDLTVVQAFAGVDELKKLGDKDPDLMNRAKFVVDSYTESLGFFQIEEDRNLFIKILEQVLSPFEIFHLLKSAKGLTFSEFLNLIPTL